MHHIKLDFAGEPPQLNLFLFFSVQLFCQIIPVADLQALTNPNVPKWMVPISAQPYFQKFFLPAFSNLVVLKFLPNASFLASQDALEVMRVTESLSHSLSVSIDFTDVTLVSDDTYRRLY